MPVSNLFELNATVAEHWLYLPSVGFLLFIVGCGLELPARGRRILIAAACIAVIGLGARSFVRSGDWLTPETFYRHAIRSGATKTRMALNLAQIYAERRDYAKAEPLLRKVVAMNPDYPMAQNALGHLLLSQGRREEAEKVFAVATKLAAKAGQIISELDRGADRRLCTTRRDSPQHWPPPKARAIFPHLRADQIESESGRLGKAMARRCLGAEFRGRIGGTLPPKLRSDGSSRSRRVEEAAAACVMPVA